MIASRYRQTVGYFRAHLRYFGFLSLIVLQGCATLSTVRSAPAFAGTSIVYNQSYERTFDATLEAVKWAGLKLVEENRAKRVIVASHGVSLMSWGERVRVTVLPLDEQHTQVNILSKRVLATNIFATDWEEKLVQTLNVSLGKGTLNGTFGPASVTLVGPTTPTD